MKVEVLDFEGNIISLTEKQKLFCELYAFSEIRGNGVKCYIEAYDVDIEHKGGYIMAKTEAHENLTKPNLLAYIRALYGTTLNDETVDNELAFLISQSADFPAKLGAIKEYNNLRQRIVKKIDHTTAGKPIRDLSAMTNEELEARLVELESKGE